MSKSAHTAGRKIGWWIGALACFSLLASPLRAQQELPQVRSWYLLPEYANPAALGDQPTYTALYGTAGSDLRHYLLQGSILWSLGHHPLRLGATLEQGKGHFWQAGDLTGRMSTDLWKSANWHLRSGLQLSLLRRTFDGARALSEGITDSQLPMTRVEGKAFDLGLGLYLEGRHLELGLSAQHILASELSLGERFSITTPRTFHAFATYIIGQRPAWSLRPSAYLSWSRQQGDHQEVGLGIHYQDRYQLRAGWEYAHSWSLSGAIGLGHFTLGYRWEHSLHDQPTRHEMFLSYRLPQLARSSRPTKYMSIRLL